jgi:hypothetical protein
MAALSTAMQAKAVNNTLASDSNGAKDGRIYIQ